MVAAADAHRIKRLDMRNSLFSRLLVFRLIDDGD